MDELRLPQPMRITFYPDGTSKAEPITWEEYDRLNPQVAWARGPDGKLVRELVVSQP